MAWFAALKRLSQAPYMVVGMSQSDCTNRLLTDAACTNSLERLGPGGHVLEVHRPTTWAFFANDVALLNWNNSGAVWVTIQRLPAATVESISSRT